MDFYSDNIFPGDQMFADIVIGRIGTTAEMSYFLTIHVNIANIIYCTLKNGSGRFFLEVIFVYIGIFEITPLICSGGASK